MKWIKDTIDRSNSGFPEVKTVEKGRLYPRKTNQNEAKEKIYRGSNAVPHEFPWMARIKVGNGLCGGSLIDNQWVITVAHCLLAEDFSTGVKPVIYLGDHSNYEIEPNEIVVEAAELFIHPFYLLSKFNHSTSTDLHYDLALIKLSRPIDYNDDIQPICLDNSNCSADVPNGSLCTIIGWGQVEEKGSVSPILQKAQVPTVGNDECQQALQKHFHHLSIIESQVCAGYKEGGSDTCQGDSGGPLICKNNSNGRLFLHGIVSCNDFMFFLI